MYSLSIAKANDNVKYISEAPPATVILPFGTLQKPLTRNDERSAAKVNVRKCQEFLSYFPPPLLFMCQDNVAELGVGEYSLSQISLEQIFNGFAAQQQEEQGRAIGMM